MKKPEFQWITASHRARRRASPPNGRWRDDARAEGFDLIFDDGRSGSLVCGLELQVADAVALTDPELPAVVTAWLLARGARRVRLEGPDGELVHAGPIAPTDLDTRPEAPAQTLVSIAPSNAEIIDSLGAFGRVLAVEDSSDWPPAVSELERLGPDLAPDLDRVAALGPDLVFASLTVPGMERNVIGLRARGVPALVFAPRSIEDVTADLRRAGRALGLAARAVAVEAQMRAEVGRLRARAAGRPTARVYLEWWPRPMFTPGAACYSNELIELAGGHNVFGDRPGASLEIDAQDLVAAAPDVCFVSWCGVHEDKLDPGRLIHRPGLEALECVRRGRVFPLDERFAGRPGPRMLEAARRMADAIASLDAAV